jgi:hypothetical protein
MGKIPEGLKRFLAKKKKKAANPNLREGTKQTQKNRLKKLMEMRRDPAKRKPLPGSRFQPAKKPAPMLKRGGSVKKKRKK